MDKKIEDFIKNQLPERQNTLINIHSIIIKEDKTVIPVLETMMRTEMIIYKCNGTMKYGLASVKKCMTLHALPIYVSKELFSKYKSLLHNTEFQKGCINFHNEKDMPSDIVKQFIADCSKIDLQKIREDYLKEKKIKAKSKK